MEYIFVAALCSYQNFQGSACNAAASAYFQKIQGQKVLDQVNKDYLDHLPMEVKQAGAVAGLWYSQKFRVVLHHGLYVGMSFVRSPDLSENFQSTNISYEVSFP